MSIPMFGTKVFANTTSINGFPASQLTPIEEKTSIENDLSENEAATGNNDSILKSLYERETARLPTPLRYNLERVGYSTGYSTVRRRLQLSETHELVQKEKEPEGVYGITEKGRKYLQGKLDATELELSEKWSSS